MIVRELLTRLGFQVDPRGAAAYERSMDRIGRHASTLQRNLGGVVGIIGSAFGVGQLARWADTWTRAGNQIRAAEMASGQTARSLSEVNDIANRSGASLESIASLYSRIMRSAGQIAGVTEKDIARVTETVAKALQAGGAAASEISSTIVQLGQALGSGRLQGDELRSILENSAPLAQAIADEFGVAVGELKTLGEEGLLVTDRVFKAILNSSTKVDAQFAASATTIERAITIFQNKFIEFIGQQDSAYGITKRLTDGIMWLGNNIEVVAGVLTLLMIPALMSVVLWIGSTTVAFAGLALAILANPITWLILGLVALALAIQDVYTWITGGKSVIGQWLGPWVDVVARAKYEWQIFIDSLKAGWNQFVLALDGIKGYLLGVWQRILTALESPWTLLWMTTIPGILELFVPTLFDPLRSAWQAVIDWMKGLWSGAMDAIGEKVRGVGARIRSWLPGGEEPAPEGRATGGPVKRGRRYMVGENGPEPFIPKTSGWILPNGLTEMLSRPMPTQVAASGGQQVTIGDVNVRADITLPAGSDEENTRRIMASIETSIQAGIRRAVGSTLSSFPETV